MDYVPWSLSVTHIENMCTPMEYSVAFVFHLTLFLLHGDKTVHCQSSSQYFGLYNWCRVGDGKELSRMEGRDGSGWQRMFVLNMQIKNTADVSL
jgi:hypothetical protein